MVKLLNPSTDFYKRLALECSGQQIAVDLFVIARWTFKEKTGWRRNRILSNYFVVFSQHCDLATLSGISKFSGGQVSRTFYLTKLLFITKTNPFPLRLKTFSPIRCKLSLDTTAITTPLKLRDLNVRLEDILPERYNQVVKSQLCAYSPLLRNPSKPLISDWIWSCDENTLYKRDVSAHVPR